MYPSRAQAEPTQADLVNQALARLALLQHSIAGLDGAPDDTFKLGLSLQVRDIAHNLEALKQCLHEENAELQPAPQPARKETVTPLLNDRERGFVDVYRQLSEAERNNIGKLMLQLQKKPKDGPNLASRTG